jgi:hypothetical protein
MQPLAESRTRRFEWLLDGLFGVSVQQISQFEINHDVCQSFRTSTAAQPTYTHHAAKFFPLLRF